MFMSLLSQDIEHFYYPKIIKCPFVVTLLCLQLSQATIGLISNTMNKYCLF